MSGWKTYEYYYETDELPIPRQTQPEKNYRLEVAFGPLFSNIKYFSWVGIGFIQEIDYKKPNPTNFSANTVKMKRFGWGR